jgi:hypothetical protein
MHQVHLNEELYREAQRRALEAGFGSVDEYVADVLQQDIEDADNLDHLFTPERLAHIDRAIAEIDAGHGFATDEVREHFRKKRDA